MSKIHGQLLLKDLFYGGRVFECFGQNCEGWGSLSLCFTIILRGGAMGEDSGHS
jgi:hypothetical protein